MQTAQEIRNPQFKYFKKAKRSLTAPHVRHLTMHNILQILYFSRKQKRWQSKAKSRKCLLILRRFLRLKPGEKVAEKLGHY